MVNENGKGQLWVVYMIFKYKTILEKVAKEGESPVKKNHVKYNIQSLCNE